jgi:hypothetical protein
VVLISGLVLVREAWNKVTTDITENVGKILDPLKGSVQATSKTTLEDLSDSTYKSVEDIRKMNPQITDWDALDVGQKINLDMDNIVDMRSVGMRDMSVDASIDYGMLPESVTGTAVTPAKAGSLLQRGVPVPNQESLAAFQEGIKNVGSIGYGTPEPTMEHWVDFNKKRMAENVGGTSTGGSLLGLPDTGKVVETVALEGARQYTAAAIAGEPEYESTGGIPMDFGHAPTIQAAAPMPTPADYMNTAMQPYMGGKYPGGIFGNGPDIYLSWMRTYGIA